MCTFEGIAFATFCAAKIIDERNKHRKTVELYIQFFLKL